MSDACWLELAMDVGAVRSAMVSLHPLRTNGLQAAPHGCVMRFFSKKSIQEMEAEFGHFFIAKNHENLRSYLIESREDRAIVTVGKLYQNQRLTKSKVNRLYH